MKKIGCRDDNLLFCTLVVLKKVSLFMTTFFCFIQKGFTFRDNLLFLPKFMLRLAYMQVFL